MKQIVVVVFAVVMAGAGAAAAVAQNRAPPVPAEIAALKVEVATLQAQVAELKGAYARHNHYYNPAGGPLASGTARTSAPAN